ncbi:MAG: chromate transporter [Candidatus Melainabacteria bacterium]|nr:MAG: chromate transporter [Candidatus Melainabacteria bacterium]
MEKNCYTIFKTFFKVGTLLLGGGYVILPLLTSELVEKKNWITSDELCEFYAIGASLPGIIAANTAIFTGRKLLGTKGAVAATVGMVLPAFLAIVLLATILSEIINLPTTQHIFWGVGIGVIVLLFLAVKEMWKKSVNDKFSLTVYIVCTILALTRKVPLALIIIGALVCGITWQKFEDRQKLKNEKAEGKE